MKERNITVVIVEPHRTPYRAEIRNTLKALQAIVGGQIEKIYNEDDLEILCNEEGKLLGLPLNRAIIYDGEVVDVIAGTFIVVGHAGAEFASLTEEEIEKAIKRYYFGEDFVCIGQHLLCVTQRSAV